MSTLLQKMLHLFQQKITIKKEKQKVLSALNEICRI
jgi:hypothetical protein